MDPGQGSEDQALSSGFGFVELVIVVACAAILGTALVPNAGKLQQEWTLRGAVQILETSLRWGHAHAISANSAMMLVVEEDGRSFAWWDPQTGARYESTARRFPGRIRIVGSPGRPLRFYPSGNAAPAGTYVVEGQAGRYRVIVNLAGRIRVQRD
jgi:Tfp pilus assembly protein FimT